jgi:spermidine/putrescine transport system substrate-binding protein
MLLALKVRSISSLKVLLGGEGVMKKITVFILTFLLTIGLLACGSDKTSEQDDIGSDGEQKLAKELKVFNWGDYLPDSVIKGFEEKYGVDVIYDPYSSNAEMLTKLKSGAVKYDIVVPTDYIAARMISQDLLAELNMDNLPNFKNIAEPFHNRDFDPGNKYTVPYLYGSIGLAFNKAKTSNVTGWKDLWNPDNAGHVLLSDVGREAVAIALQKEGLSVNDASDESLTKAKAALEELDPNVFLYDSEPADDLVGDQVWIAAAYSGAVAKAMKTNKDLDFILPEEGGVLWMDNLAIPKISENKYTAEVFINYLLEPEVSKLLTDEIPYSNPNSKAVELMTDEEKNNPASYPPNEALEKAEWFEDLGPDLPKVDRVWREVIGQ